MKKLALVAITSLFVSGCTVFGAAAAEEPPYEVIRSDGAIEVRRYGELLVAQTAVEGAYDEVGGAAFRRLAGFIFGDNTTREKVAMTAPVLQQPEAGAAEGTEIAMTAPVLQEPDGETWIMTFVMPSEFTRETLPEPNDPQVKIATIPPRTVATIRFSGLMGEKKVDRYSAKLSRWLEEHGYRAVSEPRSAGYNPPWTLPPLRRNEIHIDIE